MKQTCIIKGNEMSFPQFLSGNPETKTLDARLKHFGHDEREVF